VEDRFGSLKPGYVADAVLFDEDWHVRDVWIDGRPIGEWEHELLSVPSSAPEHGQIP